MQIHEVHIIGFKVRRIVWIIRVEYIFPDRDQNHLHVHAMHISLYVVMIAIDQKW